MLHSEKLIYQLLWNSTAGNKFLKKGLFKNVTIYT